MRRYPSPGGDQAELRSMNRDDHFSERSQAVNWADWLSGHAGWTVLVAGGVLCAIALLLS